ncbi:DUF6434 domain-containing protein [uncultured Roseobacter sp.]|uniref:DUF6434 domain-containing protein n=1 Tax=uncultured Roseobacter sp. TaxID=114847 RepID=UPI0026391EA5|nr:DUF6434 domain-containing protein [uncultured Roseobacter sp.]
MQRKAENRPDIASITSGAELRRWYWLKAELDAQARACGLRRSGGKFTILERLAHFLDTGETSWPGDVKVTPMSKFDWHSADLTPQTVITDSYRNSQNVRRFFKRHADPKFKFNIAFMAWMKENTGKTLADAVAEYKRQQVEVAKPGYQSDIAHHNQFNQYTRDFLADNPDMGMSDVRKYWALKRDMPSENGRHAYSRSDLDLTD